MKVLFVTPYFPSYPFDNYGEVVLHLAKHIGKNRIIKKIDILTPIYIKNYNDDYYKLNIYSPTNQLSKFGRVLWLITNFKRLMKYNYYDIVNIQWAFPTGLILFPFKKNNVYKTVITVRGSDVYLRYRNIFLRSVLKHIFYNSDAVICISKDLEKKVIKISNNKVASYILPSIAVDFESFKKVSINELRILKQKLDVNNRKVILYVGGITKIKGIDYLFKAVRYLKNSYYFDDFVAIIVGDGRYRNILEKKIVRQNLSDYFRLVGKVEYEQLKYYYKMADVFVLLSRTEGLGAVILEALYFGLPIVASHTGGIIDLVKHNKNGFLVPVGDYKKAAEHLYKILNNKVRLSNKNDSNINEYNYENMAQQTVSIYKTLLKKN